MPGWVMPVYTTALMAAFLFYGQAVRSNRIEGRAVAYVGTGIGLIATIASYLLLLAATPGGKVPMAAVLGNSLLMATATAVMVAISMRQQKIDDLRTETVNDTRVIVRQCAAFRIRDLDALIVPTTPEMATFEGPSGQVLAAAGQAADRETRAASPAPLDKVVVTSAGNLKVGKLFHVVVHERLKPVDAKRLQRGIEAAAQQARKSGAKRVGIALAPMRGLSVDAMASAAATGLYKHVRSFDEVVVIGLDARTAKALDAVTPRTPAA